MNSIKGVSDQTFALPYVQEVGANLTEGLQTNGDQFLRTVEVSDAITAFAPFRLGQRRVSRFIELHPVITKIYFVCHLFSIVSLVTAIPKLYKHGRRFIVKPGMERFDAAMKILAKIGEMTVSLATLMIGLEAFKMGEKLARWGLGFAETAYKTLRVGLDAIVIVGLVFSTAEVALDLRRWWRTRAYLNELTAQDWFCKRHTPKEYAQFKNYLSQMSQDQETRLSKTLGVDGASFRKAVLDRLHRKVPSGADIEAFKEIMENVKGKLKTGKKLHLFSALTNAVAVAGAACLLLPPLHPVAAVLLVASSIAILASTLFENIKRYQFEDRMGMIDRPQPKRWDWQARVVDFTKWQLGWYEEKSLIKRLTTAGSNLWENGLLAGEAVGAILKAVSVFLQAFKLG